MNTTTPTSSIKKPKTQKPAQSRPFPSSKAKLNIPSQSDASPPSLRRSNSIRNISSPTEKHHIKSLHPEFSNEQLEAEIQRVLTGKNPQCPDNIVEFSRQVQDGQSLNSYVSLQTLPHTEIHFSLDGPLVQSLPISKSKSLVTRNQFNFIDRGSQTLPSYHPKQDAATSVLEISRKVFSGSCDRGTIADVAMGKITSSESNTTLFSPDSTAVIVAERMVLQNHFSEVFHDLFYFDHRADASNPNEGSLLPLFKLNPFSKYTPDLPKSKSLRTVTAISFNPFYPDLVAISLGSLDFSLQGGGCVVLFSLKSPSFPLSLYRIDSGVLCLSWNRAQPTLLAAGMYNGSIGVFDCSTPTSIKLIRRSTASMGKHSDPCWSVDWLSSINSQVDVEDVVSNFAVVSAGTDGRLLSWDLLKNGLLRKEIIDLTNQDGLSNLISTFDFSPFDSRIYLIGTEDGSIMMCSVTSSNPLSFFDKHDLTVYSIKWSPFNQGVFLTASADWTARLYSVESKSPLLVFDLNGAVTDISWSPVSSTIFSATCQSGRVLTFDLKKNLHSPICKQVVSDKGGLTRINFNQKFGIVAVGDERGNCHVLKLSPNLRPDLKSQFSKNSTANIKVALTLEELSRMNSTEDQKDEGGLSIDEKVKKIQVEELEKIVQIAKKTKNL
ncbi:hypothetical protein RCL1_005623 [Eukaryota sp. TZLM3-RCL]